MEAKLRNEALSAINSANLQSEWLKVSDLKTIKGIGEKTMGVLIDNWIRTVEDLKNTPKEEIEKLITSPITRNQIFSFLK